MSSESTVMNPLLVCSESVEGFYLSTKYPLFCFFFRKRLYIYIIFQSSEFPDLSDPEQIPGVYKCYSIIHELL